LEDEAIGLETTGLGFHPPGVADARANPIDPGTPDPGRHGVRRHAAVPSSESAQADFGPSLPRIHPPGQAGARRRPA